MKSLEHVIREIASKKNVKEEEPVMHSEMNLPLGTADYQGSQFKTAKTVTPKIRPGHNERSETAAAARNIAKGKASATMTGHMKEEEQVDEGALETADKVADYVVPFYSAGKKLYKGDVAGAGKEAAVDVAALALGGPLGRLGGSALKGLGLVGKTAVKAGEKAAGTTAAETGLKAAEKSAIKGAETAPVKSAEKAAGTAAAETGAKAGEKAIGTTAAETGLRTAEKAAVETGAKSAEKAAGTAAAEAGGRSVVKGLGRAALTRAALDTLGRIGGAGAPDGGEKFGEKRTLGTNVHYARKHRVAEASEGTEARMKEPNVGRPDTAPSNFDKKSKLRKQGEIRTKFIDEAAKKNSNIVKDAVRQKKAAQAVEMGQTIDYPQVVVNPPIKRPSPEDYR